MSKVKIEEVFHSILSIDIDIDIVDGVTLIVKNIQEIRAADDYDGFRVSFDALIEKARIPIKVDITTGDKITPKEIIYSFDLLLDNRSTNILAYNIESVLAEKLETIISRGSANTRMRDFYDGYILLKMQSNQVDLDVLAEAIKETADYRKTRGLLASAEEILTDIFSDDQMLAYWTRHQKQYYYASEISWTEVRESIETLVKIFK